MRTAEWAILWVAIGLWAIAITISVKAWIEDVKDIDALMIEPTDTIFWSRTSIEYTPDDVTLTVNDSVGLTFLRGADLTIDFSNGEGILRDSQFIYKSNYKE